MAHETLKMVRKGPNETPQTKKAVKGQKRNDAGGYVFEVDRLARIKRFLILGSESTFYRSGESLTLKRSEDIEKMARSKDAIQLIDLITEVSVGGRAPKQDPALFALALTIASAEDPAVKSYGYAQLHKVARTGTALFKFVGYLTQFQRLGMGARKAIARWYTQKDLGALGYQMVKYKAREGWSHKDLIILSHPTRPDEGFNALMRYGLDQLNEGDELPSIVIGADLAHQTKLKDLPKLIREYRLTWEMIPSEHLNDVAVWDALLDVGVPISALIRQLGRLTNLGILKPLSAGTSQITAQLTDQERLIKGRVHPITLLLAMKTYASGRALKGDSTWRAVPAVVDALDSAFYLAYGAVEPTGKRTLAGLDVSGSMGMGHVAGVPLMPSEAVAALSLVVLNTEKEAHVVGFDNKVRDLGITRKMSLGEAMRKARSSTFGSTDTAAAIRYAREEKLDVETFLTMTDNDTWAGHSHTFQELERYRRETGHTVKSIVLATTASNFSVADPKDPHSLDISGFDTSVPQVISEFARG